jgi:hypothetical protein
VAHGSGDSHPHRQGGVARQHPAGHPPESGVHGTGLRGSDDAAPLPRAVLGAPARHARRHLPGEDAGRRLDPRGHPPRISQRGGVCPGAGEARPQSAAGRPAQHRAHLLVAGAGQLRAVSSSVHGTERQSWLPLLCLQRQAAPTALQPDRAVPRALYACSPARRPGVARSLCGPEASRE